MDGPIDRRETFRGAWPSYGPAWDEAVEAGIDVAQLEQNLRLTPEQRIVQHQMALELIDALREGVVRARLG